MHKHIMMKMVKIFTIYSFVLLLSACNPVPDMRRDSPYFTGFVGSTISLNRPLEIAPEKASVYMQWGKVMNFNALERYQPYCKFEIKTIKRQAQTVNADQFNIVRAIRDREMVGAIPQTVASLYNILSDDSPTAAIYSTELFLYSERQPDVLRITCSHWEDPADATHLTVNQIQAAMGSILTLQTKDKRGALTTGVELIDN